MNLTPPSEAAVHNAVCINCGRVKGFHTFFTQRCFPGSKEFFEPISTKGGDEPCAQTQSQSSSETTDNTRPCADATIVCASNAAPAEPLGGAATPGVLPRPSGGADTIIDTEFEAAWKRVGETYGMLRKERDVAIMSRDVASHAMAVNIRMAQQAQEDITTLERQLAEVTRERDEARKDARAWKAAMYQEADSKNTARAQLAERDEDAARYHFLRDVAFLDSSDCRGDFAALGVKLADSHGAKSDAIIDALMVEHSERKATMEAMRKLHTAERGYEAAEQQQREDGIL